MQVRRNLTILWVTAAAALLVGAVPATAAGGGAGAVYTLTNGAAGNAVAVFDRAAGGGVTPIDPNVATTETAACWVVVTGNGRYAYTTNTGSASVSGSAVDADGGLTLLDADGKTASTGASPIDAACPGAAACSTCSPAPRTRSTPSR